MILEDLLKKVKSFGGQVKQSLNAPAPQWMQNSIGKLPQAPNPANFARDIKAGTNQYFSEIVDNKRDIIPYFNTSQDNNYVSSTCFDSF